MWRVDYYYQCGSRSFTRSLRIWEMLPRMLLLMASLVAAGAALQHKHVFESKLTDRTVSREEETTMMKSLQNSDIPKRKHEYADAYMEMIEKLLLTSVHYKHDAWLKSSSRGLATTEDFAEFNAILSTLVIQLPDYSGTIAGIDLNMYDVFCTNLNVNVVELTSMSGEEVDNNATESDELDVRLYVPPGLRAECTFGWAYSTSVIFIGTVGGDGTGIGVIEESSLDATSTISLPTQSAGTAVYVMPQVIDNTCETEIEIAELDFDGGIFAAVLDNVEIAFRSILESLLEEEICKQFEGFPADVVLLLNEALEPYMNLSPSDPLSRQSSFVPQPDAVIVDFYNISAAFGGVIGNMLTAANEYLSELSSPANATNESSDLGINELIRSNLLDKDGVFTFDLDAVIVQDDDSAGNTITVTLSTMHLVGLDTFQSFGPVRAISSQTAELAVFMDSLDITMDLKVEVAESSMINSLIASTSSITEEVTVNTRMTGINSTIAAFFALDKNAIGNVTLGSIFNTTQLVPCLFSYLATPANVTQLWMEVETVQPLTFETFLSPGAEEFMNNVSSISFEMYEEAIVNALPGLFDTTLRQSINDLLAKVECPPYEAKILDGSVDFRDLLLNSTLAIAAGASGTEPYGDLIYILMDLVDEYLVDPNPDDGLPLINEILIQTITLAQSNESGTLIFPGDLFNTANDDSTFENTSATTFKVRGYDASIENLDTVGYPLHILDPVENEPFLLNNEAAIGVGNPLRGSMRIHIIARGDNFYVNNEMLWGLSFDKAQLLAVAFGKMSARSLLEFPLRDLTNPYCWAATFPAPTAISGPTLSIADVNLAAQRIILSLDCLSCSSTVLEDLSYSLQTENVIEEITAFGNDIGNIISSVLVGERMQILLDRLIVISGTKCPHHPSYSEDPDLPDYPLLSKSTSEESLIVLITLIVTAFCVFSALSIMNFITTRQRKQLEQVADDGPTALPASGDQQHHDESSLVQCEIIPLYIRALVPIVVMINIAFFLSGHLSIGGAVRIDINAFGQDISIDNIYEFSIAQALIDLWNSGAEVMSLILFVFSVLWPYVKQLVTLALWCAKPSTITHQRRGTAFSWLEAFGKWSIMDIYFLILSVSGFRVSLHSPTTIDTLPENFYSIDILVVPKWGLYANLIAQVISQIFSHIIIFYHCLVMKVVSKNSAGEKEVPQKASSINLVCDENPISLPQQIFQEAHIDALPEFDMSLRSTFQLKPISSVLFVIFSLLAAALFLAGFVIPSFELEIFGLLGFVYDWGSAGDGSEVYFSVFSIAEQIMEQAKYLSTSSDWVGLSSLTIIFVLTCFVVPLLQIVFLLLLWFFPLRKVRKKQMLNTIEILSSWRFCEVFVVCVLSGTFFLGETSKFLVNKYCEPLSSIFEFLVNFDLIEPIDGQCFYIQDSLDAGFYMLLFASVLLVCVSIFVKKITKLAVVQNGKSDDEKLLRIKWLFSEFV